MFPNVLCGQRFVWPNCSDHSVPWIARLSANSELNTELKIRTTSSHFRFDHRKRSIQERRISGFKTWRLSLSSTQIHAVRRESWTLICGLIQAWNECVGSTAKYTSHVLHTQNDAAGSRINLNDAQSRGSWLAKWKARFRKRSLSGRYMGSGGGKLFALADSSSFTIWYFVMIIWFVLRICIENTWSKIDERASSHPN